MNHLSFILIVSDPAIARHAAQAGVDYLMVDLETLGKMDRQAHVDSWKSPHTIDNIAPIREAVPDANLLVRVNPLNAGSKTEIDAVVERGATDVMLPMYRRPQEARRFLDLLDGRARSALLAETVASVETMQETLRIGCPDRVHFGLNDLHLERGDNFMFQPLLRGVLDAAAGDLAKAGVPFGIGGIARPSTGLVPAEMVLGEHVRLGSSCAILSRAFHGMAASVAEIEAEMDLAAELKALRAAYARFTEGSEADLQENHQELARRVEKIASG